MSATKIASTVAAMRALGYSSADIRGRLQQALTECVLFISREEPRDPALRSIEVQNLLDSYIQQRDALQAALAEL